MLTEAGRQIPEWWRADRFSREQKKALLRCLIDKVVVHRTAPDRVHCRVVWKGGETTAADVAVTVGSWSLLSARPGDRGVDPGAGPAGEDPMKRSPDV